MAWRAALAAIDDPAVQARLGDLLWERRARPDPHLAAVAAADGLLALAADERWRSMERARFLSRTLELTTQLRDTARTSATIERLLAFAEADLAGTDGGPGLSLGALRPLVALPSEQRPDDLDAMLQRVGEKYGADPYIVTSVADLRSPLLDGDAREELRRTQVQEWRDRAGEVGGMLRVHRLETALELARRHGCNDEVRELRSELGAIGAEELELKEIGAEIELPPEEVERFLTSFTDAPSWQHALGLLAAQPPPGGSPEELAKAVDRQMEEFPVQFLFGKSLIGPDNATAIFRASTREEHHRLASAEQRAQHGRIWGMFCARVLRRIGEREDKPSVGEMAESLQSDFVDDETGERVACAIELFWDERYDESAHVLVPRIERIVREMARQLGIPVVRAVEPGREIGGVVMLGALLREMAPVFPDEGWHAYLLNLLADPLGLNLRNSISHGLHGRVGAVAAALLVQAALFLAGLSLDDSHETPTPPPGAGAA
ncbi:MAG TPA: hypothetical protein VNV42_16215 [Solirubrobacteraceae bacterium]|nr:hypothetical protein [Solirubrobacteraceae bacterium]